MLYLPCNCMEQGVTSTTLIYSPQILYLPCNYMEQGVTEHRFNLQPTNVIFTL